MRKLMREVIELRRQLALARVWGRQLADLYESAVAAQQDTVDALHSVADAAITSERKAEVSRDRLLATRLKLIDAKYRAKRLAAVVRSSRAAREWYQLHGYTPHSLENDTQKAFLDLREGDEAC